MFNRDAAPDNNKPSHCFSSHQPNAGKSGTFNEDFPPWWGMGGGWRHKHSRHVVSLLDKRQPGGSRRGEVDDGEDAECVSSKPLKAFWWCEWVNSLCAKEMMFLHAHAQFSVNSHPKGLFFVYQRLGAAGA